MIWLLFVLCIAILLFVWFIVYSSDDLETAKTLKRDSYSSASKKEKFIHNYHWCVENLTSRGTNLFEARRNENLEDTRRFNYYIPYTLSRSLYTYSFSELGSFETNVTNGSGYDCYGVDAFYDEFNGKVEKLRDFIDAQDMSLYKKYKISYTNLLTNVLNK